MHITVLGAGALGRAYGLRLAAAGDSVSFVVRPSRAGDTSAFVIEQVGGSARRDAIEHPERVTAIPDRTQLVLVAVRFDQLAAAADAPAKDELAALLRAAPRVPIVTLTPMLTKQKRALEAAIGRPITSAIPSVSGYIDERGVVRYWAVRVASTLIDEPVGRESDRLTLDDLARHLTNAGIGAHLERGVDTLNAATTVSFFPLIAAIDAGGGIDGVLSNKELLTTVLDAAKESEALAHKIGKVAPWAGMLTKFVGPYTLKPAVALGRKLIPEIIHFVEAHFGPKLHAQHVAMGDAILELGREHGVAMPKLEELMQQVQARAR